MKNKSVLIAAMFASVLAAQTFAATPPQPAGASAFDVAVGGVPIVGIGFVAIAATALVSVNNSKTTSGTSGTSGTK